MPPVALSLLILEITKVCARGSHGFSHNNANALAWLRAINQPVVLDIQFFQESFALLRYALNPLWRAQLSSTFANEQTDGKPD